MAMDRGLSWLKNNEEIVIDYTKKLSAINSYSYNQTGLSKIARNLKANFRKITPLKETLLPIYKTDEPLKTKLSHYAPLLTGNIRPDLDNRIFLCGHLDTVFHPSLTFPIIETNSRIHGPGIADMKGGLSVMLFALQAFEQFQPNPAIGFNILINPDEEIGSVASRSYIEDQSTQCKLGLIFEPESPNGMIRVRGGSITLSVAVYGKAAHAGRNFYQGIHAGYIAADLISNIRKQFLSKKMIINVSQINCPGPMNQVAPFASFKLNVRYLSDNHCHKFLADLHSLLSKTKIANKAKILLKTIAQRPSKPLTKKEKELQTLLNKANKSLDFAPINWTTTQGVCDSNFLSQKGIPSIDTLGPLGNNLHTTNEYLEKETLLKKAQLTYQLLVNCNQLARQGNL